MLGLALWERVGSITELTKSNGSAVNTYTYATFGGDSPANAETVANPFHFTAREYDPETKLYYYRARYYDPLFGRFLSEDPIGFSGGIDFYAYVGNNPANRVDPGGRGVVDCLKAIAELAAATANVKARVDDIIAHAGSPDPGDHSKALQQAVNRLNNALEKVVKHCSCYAAAASAIAAAGAAIEAAAPYLFGALPALAF